MDAAELGSAITTASGLALLAILFGVVILRVVNEVLVEQSLSGGEGLALVCGSLMVLGVSIKLWGTPFLFVPPAIGLLAYAAFAITLDRQQREREARHWSSEERRSRDLLTRDPQATVGFAHLATALEKQGRVGEALAVLEEWHAADPTDREAVSRLNALRGPGAPKAVVGAPLLVELTPVAVRDLASLAPEDAEAGPADAALAALEVQGLAFDPDASE